MKKEYTIVLKNNTQEQSENPIAGNDSSSVSASSNSTSGGGGSFSSSSAKNIAKGLVAYNTYVKPFVGQFIEHQINTISLRTGANERQQRIQFAYQIGQQVVGIGASILTGFAIGNVAGAVAGAVLGVASTLINYANKADTLALESSLEGVTLNSLNIRAGGYLPSYSGSRSLSRT